MTHPSLDDVRKAIRSFGDDTNEHLEVLIEVAELYLQSSQGKGVSVEDIVRVFSISLDEMKMGELKSNPSWNYIGLAYKLAQAIVDLLEGKGR